MLKKFFSAVLLAAAILCGSQAYAQTVIRTLTGSVVDSNGEGLIGASLVIKGTSTGFITDLSGNYEMKDVKFPTTIVVSSMGYKDVEINLTGNEPSPYKIVLDDENSILDDAVVVGYATMKKRNLVGAVDQVDSKVIAGRPNGNLARSLQGVIAGLNISFTDGKPSRNASYNVRGETSIGAGGSTLVLIDGVEGDMNTINPQDVESVSVLKDASSTAVYGARGAFGVILVTTKKAKKGSPVINYNGATSINRRTVIYDNITDSVEWLDWWKTCYNNYYNGSKALLNHIDSKAPYSEGIYNEIIRRNADPSLAKVEASNAVSGFGYAYYDNTDWLNLFYKPYHFSTEHNVSASGGNEHADYYISGRYYDSEGIYNVGNENYKKYDLRAKGSLSIRPWFHLTNNLSFGVYTSLQPRTPSGNSAQRYLQHCAQPMAPLTNLDGSWTPAAAMTGYASYVEGKNRMESNSLLLREKINADIDIIKDVLKFQADYSFNYTGRTNLTIHHIPTTYSKAPGVFVEEGSQATSGMTEVRYDTRYQAVNAYLTFTPELGKNHNLTLLGGYNVEWNNYTTRRMARTGFTTYDKLSFNLMNGVPEITSGGYEWAYMGAFYRLNYSFKGRYLAEISGRYDGSSKFPSYSRWGLFPSASVAWRFSDESFMQWAEPILSNGKIRISAGSMGNGNVNPYLYTSEMALTTSSAVVLGGNLPTTTTVAGVVPKSLTWETATTYDAGLDLDFFNSRLSFTGDYYVRETTDMFTVSETLPAVYGASAPRGNNASMETLGWEISLQWRDSFNLADKPFNYSIKGTLWDSNSYITSYKGNSSNQIVTSLGNLIKKNYAYYEGQHIGDIWGYTVEGLFLNQEDIDNHAKQTFIQSSDKVQRPGEVKVKDLDGSDEIDYGKFTLDDHGDLSIIGDSTPHYRYGINLSANWSGFGISAFFQGVGKQDWYPGSDAGYFWGKYGRPFFYFIPSIHKLSNPTVAQLSEDGSELLNPDTAYWPRVSTYQSNGSTNNRLLQIANTRYMQSIAYLRLKNLQIDYTFNKKVCDALHISSLKVYLSCENLFCLTPLHKWGPNLDPEGLGVDTDYSYTSGYQEGNTYPLFKTATLGVNLTF